MQAPGRANQLREQESSATSTIGDAWKFQGIIFIFKLDTNEEIKEGAVWILRTSNIQEGQLTISIYFFEIWTKIFSTFYRSPSTKIAKQIMLFNIWLD